MERHRLEKIKTTGDTYMVVSGVPSPRPDHAAAWRGWGSTCGTPRGTCAIRNRRVPIRIGIASGPVVAGVVGTKKFFYDVWGDAVNVASRMELTGEPGRIQVTPDTYERLKDQFALEIRGPIDVKGKGQMPTWFLVGCRANEAAVPLLGRGEPRMNCKNCGSEISPGRKFCTACGTPVTEVPATISCTACGTINPGGAKFCGECGSALKPAPQPGQDRPKPPPTDPDPADDAGRRAAAADGDVLRSRRLDRALDRGSIRRICAR